MDVNSSRVDVSPQCRNNPLINDVIIFDNYIPAFTKHLLLVEGV